MAKHESRVMAKQAQDKEFVEWLSSASHKMADQDNIPGWEGMYTRSFLWYVETELAVQLMAEHTPLVTKLKEGKPRKVTKKFLRELADLFSSRGFSYAAYYIQHDMIKGDK